MFVKLFLIQGGFWDLMAHASLVAYIVSGILLIMSLGSWGILINKWRIYNKVAADSLLFFNTFHRRIDLPSIESKCLSYMNTPLSSIFAAGYNEYKTLIDQKSQLPSDIGVRVRLDSQEIDAIDWILEAESAHQLGKLEKSIAFLATTGNVAPFFGLLGTCWGIMNSFLNIGVTKSASLVVVAPGIAEALVATVFGLAVAIPAVIGFNWCNTKLKFINDDMNRFSLKFLAAVAKEHNS